MKWAIIAIVVVAASAAAWFTLQGHPQAAPETPAQTAISANPAPAPASTDSIPERIRGSWYRPARQPLNSEPNRIDLSNSQVIFHFPQRPEAGVAMPVVFVRQDQANAWAIDVTVTDPDFGKVTRRYLVRMLEDSPIGDERLGNKSTLKSMLTISRWWGDLNAAPTTQEQDAKAKTMVQQLNATVGWRPVVSNGSFLTKADADKWSKYLIDYMQW